MHIPKAVLNSTVQVHDEYNVYDEEFDTNSKYFFLTQVLSIRLS